MTPTRDSTIRTEIEPPIGWLVVDRPETRGAMTRAMWEALPGALERLDADERVRVVVVRGTAGNFIAGADINEFAALRSDPDQARRYDEGAVATLETLAGLSKPSIAMIEGACFGGGCLVAFGCDLRLAADDARLAIPAGRLGLAYPYDAVERLVAVAGEPVALDLLLTGRAVGGTEARALGLVHRAVPAGELEGSTRKLAETVAANAPLALRYARLAVRRRAPSRVDEAERRRLAAACFESEDYHEGVQAFLDKRAPRFRGR